MNLWDRIKYRWNYTLNLRYYQNHYDFDGKLLNEVKHRNRSLINSKDFKIVDQEVMKSSHFGYGIPDQFYNGETFLLNNPINDDTSYSDVICYFSNKLKNLRYLEIGVSVGKNFYQVMNYLDNSYMMGYDLEEMSPLLKAKLNTNNSTVEKWDKKNFLKPTDPSIIRQMKHRNNTIDYIAADIYDESGWKYLQDKQFNLILSDASHTPEAILFEYEMMEKYNVFNRDSFVIFWDDLGGKMTDSFIEIISQMKKKYQLKRSNCYMLELSGWIGQYEFKHQIGIVAKNVS